MSYFTPTIPNPQGVWGSPATNNGEILNPVTQQDAGVYLLANGLLQNNIMYWTRAVGLKDSDVLNQQADIIPAIQAMWDSGVGFCMFPAGAFLLNSQAYHTGQMPFKWIAAGTSQILGSQRTSFVLGSGLAGADVDHCNIALRIHEVPGQGTTVRGVYEHTFGTEVVGSKNDETNQVIEGFYITSSADAQTQPYLPSFLLSADIGVTFRNCTFDHLLLGGVGVQYADGFQFDTCKVQSGKVGTDSTHYSVMFFQAGLGDNVKITHCKGGNSSSVFVLKNARGAIISPAVGGGGLLSKCLDFIIEAGHFDADDTSTTTTQFLGVYESQGSTGIVNSYWFDAPWAVLAHIVPFFCINDLNANEPSDILFNSLRGNITLDSTRQGSFRLGDIHTKAVKAGTTMRLRRCGLGGFTPTTSSNAIGPYLTCDAGMTAMTAQLIDPSFVAQLCGDIDLTCESANQAAGTYVVRGAGGAARSLSQLTLPTLAVSTTAICPNSTAGVMQRNYTVIAIDAAGRAAGFITGDASATSAQSLQLVVGNLICRPHALVILSADGAGIGSQLTATRWCAVPVGYLPSVTLVDIGTSLNGIPWQTANIPTINTYSLDLATRNWTTSAIIGKATAAAGGVTNAELRSPVTVLKTADQSITANNVLAADADLRLWLPVGSYKITMYLKYQCEGNTGSIGELQISFTTPTGRQGFYDLHGLATSVNATGGSQGRASNAWGSTASIGGSSANPTVATVEGILTVTTAGPVILNWAQLNSSAVATTLFANSSLTAVPI